MWLEILRGDLEYGVKLELNYTMDQVVFAMSQCEEVKPGVVHTWEVIEQLRALFKVGCPGHKSKESFDEAVA